MSRRERGASDATPVEARSGLLAGRPWAAVALLGFLLLFNYLDRLLPAVLAEPLKRDLGLSDTFLGAVNGVGFLAVYAVAAIPIARLADTGRYGAVISACLGFWSVMTILGSRVVSGWQLALTRVGLAVGEAGSAPASHAYISRNFPPDQRPKALAVMNLAGPVGTMVAMSCGGLLGQWLGWHGAFLAMGVTGLAIAPVALIALGRGQPTAHPAGGPSPGGIARLLRKPTVAAILIGNGLVAFAGYIATSFSPAFLVRVHGLSVGAAGLQFGLWSGLTGVPLMLGVSTLCARLSRKDPRATVFAVAVMGLASLPLGFAAYTVADARLAVALAAIANDTTLAYLPLTIAVLHSLVPAERRAQISAAQMFCAGVFGGLGPLMTGMISDALTPSLGAEALGRALLLSPAVYGLAALIYLVATRTLRRDLIEEIV
jgi:MFS family permease